jgi:hypothetical protein
MRRIAVDGAQMQTQTKRHLFRVVLRGAGACNTNRQRRRESEEARNVFGDFAGSVLEL